MNLPESIAAIAVTTLNVDPGGYWPWVVRLSSGASGSWFSRLKMSGIRLGSYCGTLAITFTAPELGSNATTAPFWPPRASMATRWARVSRVVKTLSPSWRLPCSSSTIDVMSSRAPVSALLRERSRPACPKRMKE